MLAPHIRGETETSSTQEVTEKSNKPEEEADIGLDVVGEDYDESFCKILDGVSDATPPTGVVTKEPRYHHSLSSPSNNNDHPILKRKINCETPASVDIHKSRKKDTSKCNFCHQSICHNLKYGVFCARETRPYMKSENSSVEGMFKTYAKHYTIALKLDLFRKYGADVKLVVGMNELPSCMLNGTYLACLNEYEAM